jgi:outer membrane lipoprotein-sorting protein
MKRTLVRWIPAIVAPVLIAGTAVGFSVSANAAIDLPDKNASQILQLMNTNPDIAFSGKVVKTAKLGLPPMNILPKVSDSMVEQATKNMPKEMADFIPKASAQGQLALALEFLGGTHVANVYVDGAEHARIQVLDMLSERDFIRNGSDLWSYDAGKQSVQHGVINPADQAQAEKEGTAFFNQYSSLLPFDATSPAAVADYFLAQAGTDATFSVDKDVKIAGRGAYQITMAPKSADSLVQSVSVAIDAATGLPLSVVVRAVGQATPAFEVAFQSISFAKPDASLFDFVVPAGATVEEVVPPTKSDLMKYAGAQGNEPAPSAADQALAMAEIEKMRAAGWSAVLAIPADKVPAEFKSLITDNSLFAELTNPVTGGRVFSTALVNILFTDDGRIFAGAVNTQKLLKAAQG